MTQDQLNTLATYRGHNCSSLLYGRKPCNCERCQLALKILAERDAKMWPKEDSHLPRT